MTDKGNVIELTSARSRLRAKGSTRSANDNRVHGRMDSDDRLFVQVVLSADDPDLVGATLSCNAVNLSIGGIQFRTDAEIATGSLLDLWVDISSRPGKFFLAGEVRWSRPTGQSDVEGNDEWFIGVQLKSGAATDILDWRDFHGQVSIR
ncbi:MAG: PilZ domain-containing protein [Gammaproteobacteria bacterium]|nr:PilZ domain-containing protein [Gammaproteobacteria bacterium]